MKKITMKYLCLIFTLFALPSIGFSQYIGDTVVVYIDNKVELKIAVEDYEDLKTSTAVETTLTEFGGILPQIHDQLSAGAPDLVEYSNGEVRVKPGNPSYTYLVQGGTVTNTGYRDQAVIRGESYMIFITTSDLTNIDQGALIACLKKVIAQLPRNSNWSKNLSYECIAGTVTEIAIENNNLDMLEFSGGVGANLLKGEWAADLSVGIGLGFAKKGVLSYNPYISANFIFDFPTNTNIDVNTFLNLGYRWNVNKKNKKSSMLGVELGYLISKQGEVFGESTFKLGMNWTPIDAVTVSPILYMTDKFKTAYPGIRIGIGF